ncbi:MAG: hypothetical protein R3D84_18165 [Paracoccaceae bacterium]
MSSATIRFASFLRHAAAAAVLAAAGAAALPAAAQDSRRVYVFGNSLVYHLTKTERTAVPYWLGLMTRAGGKSLALEGRWGFLRDFANELPAQPNWEFSTVSRAWKGGDFRGSGFDTIIITPANFIQGRPASKRYQGDNPTGDSPLSAALKLIDWLSAAAPKADIFIYEGWSLMGGFPPDAQQIADYHALNRGSYHKWFVDFTSKLRQKSYGQEVRLIPVASVLSAYLTQPPLSELKPTDLYEDDAPHGTETLYLLAAMITYSSLFNEPAPAIRLPSSVHPTVRKYYSGLATAIYTTVAAG